MPPSESITTETRRTQFYKGVLELAVMSLLKAGAQYGLQILEGLRAEVRLDVSEGSVYPLLHRMEKAGLIAAEWRLDADASHPRKYYSLTPRGRVDLTQQTRVWLEMAQSLNAFLARDTPHD